jgi:hypothetical protein
VSFEQIEDDDDDDDDGDDDDGAYDGNENLDDEAE